MKKLANLFGALLLLSQIGSAVVAQTGMAMMKVEPGARPAGLGGAFVSISGDPMSPIYNPAGAVGESDFLFGSSYTSYWENISIQTGYVTGRVSQDGFLFAGIRYAGVTDIERRLNNPSAEPIGEFSAHDISFKGGAAYRANDRLAVGIAVGWFLEKIEVYSGFTFNFDMGVLFEYNRFITMGASATNIGDDFVLGINDQQESDVITVPKTYRVGLSYERDYYLGSFDVVTVDDEAHAHFGAEYLTQEYFTIRAGYMTGYDSKNVTFGGSVLVPNYRLAVNYALIPYSNNLGTTHQFGLTYGL